MTGGHPCPPGHSGDVENPVGRDEEGQGPSGTEAQGMERLHQGEQGTAQGPCG